MDLMQPIAANEIEHGSDWLYEVKYDGFRAILVWAPGKITITSRNDKNLTSNFPEIVAFCKKAESLVADVLPVQLDGELAVLNNRYQANFSAIQKRGRLKAEKKIQEASASRPATFLAFDLLQVSDTNLRNLEFVERKRRLSAFFKKLDAALAAPLQRMETYEKAEKARRIVFEHKGEGIVAKRKASKYRSGKSHRDWLKVKNWRDIHLFLTAYDSTNGYFQTEVFDGDFHVPVGKCKHGLDEESARSLKKLFTANGEKEGRLYRLPPAICASVHTLDLHEKELREPEFSALMPEESPEACTIERLKLDLAMIPEQVDISNEAKIFWSQKQLAKSDLLVFMREIYPYMIPYVKNRALTVIRCPDGVEEESFFQKNLPDYAPDYIEFIKEGDKRIQLCNDVESLIWHANHGAIEYHVPFQAVDSPFPKEIVFDLDPPSRNEFSLAIKAALMIKSLLDELELVSFVKTSGNTGLQIHIPIPHEQLSYDETAVFTEAIAKIVENAEPAYFTTERFKKNRGGRLYIDYVQHGKNKTIIAPYSPRKTEEATVATPLYWEEVTENLKAEKFTIQNVVQRVQKIGCPWYFRYEAARPQKLAKVYELIQEPSP